MPDFEEILAVVRRLLHQPPHTFVVPLELRDLAGFRGSFDLEPSFDRRDPDPEKNYGISSARACLTLAGPDRGVYFMFSTGWYLQTLFDELLPKEWRLAMEDRVRRDQLDPLARSFLIEPRRTSLLGPIGFTIGYHSPTPLYPNHQPQTRECEITGGLCFAGERYHEAEHALETMISGGTAALWPYLRDVYRGQFEMPDPEREQMAEWSKTVDWSTVRTMNEIPQEEKRAELRKAYNDLRNMIIEQGQGPVPPPMESFGLGEES